MTLMSCISLYTCIKTGDSTPEVTKVTLNTVEVVLVLEGTSRVNSSLDISNMIWRRNVNIPWPSQGMGDGDYMYAFQQVVMPIAQEFNPDLVISMCFGVLAL